MNQRVLYAVTGVLVASVLLWATFDLLDANRRAQYESNLRAALWRMDSRVDAVLAKERERDPAEYAAFPVVKKKTYTKSGFQEVQVNALLEESSLLTQQSDFVELHFQVDQEGNFSSPQVPIGVYQEQAVPKLLSQDAYDNNVAAFDSLRAEVDPKQLGLDLHEAQSRTRNAKKTKGRQRLAQPETKSAGNLEPIWIDRNLYFVRTVKQGANKQLQGFIVDWPKMRAALLDEIDDLFPEAELTPYPGAEHDRALFTLPARLEPGLSTAGAAMGTEYVGIGLMWLLVVGGYVAFGRAMSKAERQRRFASHVTHELRSPLTTFQLYSDLLAEGLVKDPEKTQGYLRTLQSESRRMGQMIENVIAQARLEAGRARAERESTTVADVIDREALQRHCDQHDMTISIDVGDEAILVDRDGTGRILMNLVENACKYGEGPVTITSATRGGKVQIRVRDSGPVVSRETAEQFFKLYHRGGRDETDPNRGLGLGLPLSRELARSMHGDLVYDDGAFTLLVTKG